MMKFAIFFFLIKKLFLKVINLSNCIISHVISLQWKRCRAILYIYCAPTSREFVPIYTELNPIPIINSSTASVFKEWSGRKWLPKFYFLLVIISPHLVVRSCSGVSVVFRATPAYNALFYSYLISQDVPYVFNVQ